MAAEAVPPDPEATKQVAARSGLRDPKEGLRAVLDGLPAMIAYWDRDLRNVMANRAYMRYFGRTPEEMGGMHIRDVLGPDLFAQNLPYMERALAGEAQLFDRAIPIPSGEVRYTQASYIPDVVDGEVGGFFVLVTDISERRRAELALQASEERYRVLVEQLPGGVMTLVDPRLRVEWVDGRIVHETGMDRERVIGRPVGESAGGGEHGRWVESLYARALHGESVSVEMRSQLTGRDFRLEIGPVRGPDGSVSGALSVAQDITERREREAEDEALASIATLVAQAAGPVAVFMAVAEQLGRLLAGSVALVARFDSEREEGAVLGGWAQDAEDPTGGVLDLRGETATAQVFRTARPARLEHAKVELADGAAERVRRYAVTASIAAPITVDGAMWGSIGVGFSGRPCPPRAEERLERFAPLVALAISNAEAWATLARQASTDPVTGIANHRTFQSQLRSEIERARRYERDLSLVLVDVDHFKAVNDRHGHQVGDRVLAEVARRLAGNARDGELVARIGGEEFAWLMPETSERGAYAAADRLRRAIESDTFPVVGRLTVSAGVCSIEHGKNADELVRFADRALYWAKDSGRNMTFAYTPDAQRELAREDRRATAFQVLSSVRSLARAIDAKDWSTHSHSERVAELAERLALQLGWTAKRARMLHGAGLLHDVGKIGVADHILLKSSRLTAAEYETVKHHVVLSAEIAADVLEPEQVTWIRSHHERWDGTGYPDGLTAAEIPEGAQILAVADAWDVMTQTRSYKSAMTPQQALEECRSHRDRQFASHVIDALHTLADDPQLDASAQP